MPGLSSSSTYGESGSKQKQRNEVSSGHVHDVGSSPWYGLKTQ